MIRKDYTLLICGPYHPHTSINVFKNKNSFNQIIISSYVKDRYLWEKVNLQDCKLILSEFPELDGVNNEQNLYLQVYTTKIAIKNVSTKYFIKCRTDEFYSNLELLFMNIPQKFISSNIL